MNSRFEYVKFDAQSELKQTELKAAVAHLEDMVEHHLPGHSRAKSLVLTKIEEAYMWMGKELRDEQLKRNSDGKTEAPKEG